MHPFQNRNLYDFYRCCHSYVIQTGGSHRFPINIWVHISLPGQLIAKLFFLLLNYYFEWKMLFLEDCRTLPFHSSSTPNVEKNLKCHPELTLIITNIRWIRLVKCGNHPKK